ncbi:MAG: PDR/VanB family oxidoreductase, partial [Motiliproteus sp.]
MAELELDDYRARVERGFIIKIEGFDWNCPQHITPRYSEGQVQQLVTPLTDEIQQLKASLADSTKTIPRTEKTMELGDGSLSLQISGIRQLTPRVRAYELRHPEGGELPSFTAGAHVQIPVQLEDGKTVYRHYSICSNPKRRDMYEIAVLLDDEGQGGSRAVHSGFEIGLTLHCQPPENYFGLHDDDRPAVLIAGGIGITPIKAMAQTLKCRGTDMQLHYAGRDGDEMAFLDRLQREFGEQINCYRSQQDERMDLAHILSSAASDSLIYICGPERLIAGVISTAESLGIDLERIRSERFSAAPEAGSQAIEVELSRSGIQIEVAADQSILDAMLEQGVAASFGCRTGNCKSCVLKVVEGEVDHRDTALSAEERTQQRLMTPCVSRAIGKKLVLDI